MLTTSAVLSSLLAFGHAAALKDAQLNALLQPGENVDEVLRRDARIASTLTRRQDENSVDASQINLAE